MVSAVSKYFCIVLITAIFASCAGQQPQPELPGVREINLQELNRLLENDEAISALETVDILSRRGLIGDREHQRYREDIAKMVDRLFTETMDSGDYYQAKKYYDAAELAGFSLDDSWSQRDVYRGLIENLVAKDLRIPAYSLGLSAFESGILSSDELQPLREDARGAGYDQWAELLRDSPGKQSDDSTMEDKLAGIVDSTVTIWVNRGMRIEGGMGYPDRVIGSGFFIDYSGYLLTNYHVVSSEVDPEYDGFSRLFIRRGGSSSPRIPAKVIGWDPVLDLALLKAEVSPDYVFTPENEDLNLGERIYAIGSPGGLEKTITSGIVSAFDRRLVQIGDAMQIDVPVNQGNSGGPLLNEKGALIGIVFAGIEFFEGINFAIPVFWLQKILPSLYEGGAVRHAWIGAALHEDKRGLTALYTAPASPASRCGIQEGDKLLSVNGVDVSRLREVHEILTDHKPGDLVRTRWETGESGDPVTIFMALQHRPESPVLEAYERGQTKELVLPLFGIKIQPAGSTLWEKKYVITKVYPGSIADETGLSVNDPFYWRGFEINEEQKVALLRIIIKKRKAGFLESSIQLGAYIDVDYFI